MVRALVPSFSHCFLNDTDLEGELAEKQRETYTQISAYDHYFYGLHKMHNKIRINETGCIYVCSRFKNREREFAR